MNKFNKSETYPIKIKPYALALTLIWSAIVTASLLWNVYQSRQGILDVARIQARNSFIKDVIYRRWNAGHGGVYVPATDKTPSNPYLEVTERDITTHSGVVLTLMNPAYMTRQVHELSAKTYGIQGHITSLNPIRPANAPDPWEIRALEAFQYGAKEISSIEEAKDDTFLRLMRPLVTEKGCLKCHAAQGYKIGDIRGGISLSVPMSPLWAIERSHLLALSLGHSLLWLVGLVGIGLGSRRLSKQITDRNKAEEALQKSESMRRGIFMTAPVGITVVKDRTFIDANKEFCNIVGYNENELIGNTTRMFYESEEEWLRVGSEMYTSLWDLGFARVETQHLRKDGEIRDIVLRAAPVLPDDASAGVVVAIEDITDRKQTEEELQKLASVVKYSSELINLANLDGKMIFLNEAGSKMLGIASDKVEQVHIMEVIPDDLKELVQTELLPTLMDGKTWEGDLQYRNIKTREITDVHAVTFTVKEPNTQKPLFLANVSIDITERKRAEEEKAKLEIQLQQAYKMESIGTLAGGIAHDFNNILSPIILHTELVLEDISEKDHLRLSLEEILRASMRAKDLVKQILTFSRQTEQERIPLIINPVVKEALKLLRSSLPSTIEIRQNIEAKVGVVLADPTQIHQILMNIGTNAANAMRERGGVLEVSLVDVDLHSDDTDHAFDLEPGQYIKLTVSDTGHGIEPAIMDKIFDPYFTTQEKGKGTGLGLSVVHGIVKTHGGHISVYSEPDKGTRFDVYLPLFDLTDIKAETVSPEKLATCDEHILLVDDEKQIVDVVQQMLERLGYQVTVRTSSIEALEVFRASMDKFDLVITDLTMPNMTGDKLAGELMNIRPDIPIILCTGFSERMTKKRAESLGIKGFLMKPIVTSDLAKLIREVIDKR